jgi:GT2 family glycosyltransferase
MSNQRVSVIITAYNAAGDLPACLDGLLQQRYEDFEVIVVDNASNDATPQVAARYQQFINYIRLKENVAVAGGYNAGAAQASGDILVFINADTIPQGGWLAALVCPIFDNPAIGMTTSRILLAQSPHLINTCGNDITWTGLTVCRGVGENAEKWQDYCEVSAVSGAACAIRRSIFEKIGGFDETFEFYLDDTDLSLRARLLGYQIWYVPDSVIHHQYTFKFSTQKAYYLERNRWLAILKIFRLPTLLLLLPGLLLGEMIAWVYSAMKGRSHLRAKFASWRWLWANRKKITNLRRGAQAFRKISDEELLKTWSSDLRFTGTVPDFMAHVLEVIAKPILGGYGAICRKLLAVKLPS